MRKRKNMDKNFDITVLIPLDKNADYLDKAVISVMEQKFDIKNRVKIIFFHEGSVEKEVEDLAEKYISKYPDNIKKVTGTENINIETSFVTLLYGLNQWSRDVFQKVQTLYEEDPNKVSVFIERYEPKKNKEKIKEPVKDKIGYFINYPDFIQDNPGKYILEKQYISSLIDIYHAKSKLAVLEILAGILAREKKMGIMYSVRLYGKNIDYPKDREWYLREMVSFSEKIKQGFQDWGYEDTYHSQFWLMYMIVETMMDDISTVLNKNELEQYKNWVQEKLSDIDDYVINMTCKTSYRRKYAFRLKYGDEYFERKLFCRRGKLYFHNLLIFNMESSVILKNMTHKKVENSITISLDVWNALDGMDIRYFILDKNHKRHYLAETGVLERSEKCFSEVIARERRFTVEYPYTEWPLEEPIMYEYKGAYIGVVSGLVKKLW